MVTKAKVKVRRREAYLFIEMPKDVLEQLRAKATKQGHPTLAAYVRAILTQATGITIQQIPRGWNSTWE